MSARTNAITPRVILQMLIIVVVFPFLPLIISGHWAWWEAWVYALISVLGFIISRLLAVRRHPDILVERARSVEMKDAKSWDKILAPMLALGNILILVVAGLDRLYSWSSPFTLTTKIVAIVVILLGYWLGSCLLGRRADSDRPWAARSDRRALSLHPPSWLCQRFVGIYVHPTFA
jgi:hypothetical protein